MPTWFSVALLLLLSSLAASQTEPSSSGDWTVTSDTLLHARNLDIEGNLTVMSGARLTLEGSHLRIGGRLHVQQDATLELLPLSGAPSQLSALPGGNGFWIHIEGLVSSRGTGSAEISDLWGHGLISTLPGNEGGLQIFGHAALEGIRIRDGTAGLFVAEGANAVLRDVAIEGLGESGITVLGNLSLERTTVAGNEAGLIGKDTCDITVQQSRFVGQAFENLLINGCRANVRQSTIEGGGVGVVANNHAHVTVLDTVIQGYAIDGLNSYASISRGQTLRPTLHFQDVVFEPGAHAKRGVDLEGSAFAEFVNVTISGHTSHGIQAKQAVLSIRDSSLEENGGYGIHLVGGHFLVDPLEGANRFGSIHHGANEQGPLSHTAIIAFQAARRENGLLEHLHGDLNVTVRTAAGEPVVLLNSRPRGEGVLEVAFQTYEVNADGQPRFVGPFEYVATHPAWEGTRTGAIDLDEPIVMLVVKDSAIQVGLGLVGRFLSMLMFLGGLGLLVFGVVAKKRRRAGRSLLPWKNLQGNPPRQ